MMTSTTPATKPRPVRPRDAASLVIFRGGDGKQPVEVVLGRRQSKSSFMPDVYVFPGGAVDAADARARAATPLAEHMQTHMAVANSQARAHTIAMAAIRETFEETGLLVTQPGKVASRIAADSWKPFSDRGIAPNLAPLHYLGRALTPSHRPIRFHARFFAVHEHYINGTMASSDELLDVNWYPSNTNELKLMGVTQRMLREVEALATHPHHKHIHIGSLFYTGRGDRRYETGIGLTSSNSNNS